MTNMKHYLKAAVGALLFVVLTTSCGINPLIVYIGDDQAGETALYVATNTAEAATSGFRYTGFAAALNNTADEVLELEFAGGLVDADTVAAGIVIYPLSDAADNNTAYVRGTALAKGTVSVLPDGTGGSIVRIALDLSGGSISDSIEVAIDPATLTANGGLELFNQDNDDALAEAGDDVAIDYVGVTGAPVTLATGAERDPQATIVINFGTISGFTDGTQAIDLVFENALGAGDNMTAESLTGSFVFQKYAFADGAWSLSDVSYTTVYAAGTGTVTFTLAAAVQDFEMYRVLYDRAQVTESAAVVGFTHRGSYDIAGAAEFQEYTVGSFEDFVGAAAITTGGGPNSRYVDVPFNATELEESTISTDSIKLYNTTQDVFVPDSMIADVAKIAADTVRIELAQPFVTDFAGYSGQDTFLVVAYPNLRDNNGTPADTTDDIAFGEAAGTYAPGTASATFTFGGL